MRSKIEKNKEEYLEAIETLCEQKPSDSVASKLSAYRGAYKALCMIGEERGLERREAAYYAEKKRNAMDRAAHKDPTPELDGDTEFERIIMAIPADAAHMVKITHIFNKHLESLKAVNARAYNSIMEQLRELAKS